MNQPSESGEDTRSVANGAGDLVSRSIITNSVKCGINKRHVCFQQTRVSEHAPLLSPSRLSARAQWRLVSGTTSLSQLTCAERSASTQMTAALKQDFNPTLTKPFLGRSINIDLVSS
jgi:hypothetical protein